jgi:hypothetical protein
MSNKDEFIIDTKLWSLEREKEKDSCCKSWQNERENGILPKAWWSSH